MNYKCTCSDEPYYKEYMGMSYKNPKYHQCDACIQSEAEMMIALEEYWLMRNSLAQWSGNVKNLRVGKPKHKKNCANGQCSYACCDDELPF